MNVTVRRANKTDARRVAEMAVRLVEQHREYDSRRFAKLYEADQAEWFYGERSEAENAAVFVAEIENRIVGMAFLEFEEIGYAEMITNAAWLHDLFVEPEARSSGTGKLLIDAAAEWSKSVGAGKLMLTVAARNELAHEFFENRGFRPTMIEMMLDLEA